LNVISSTVTNNVVNGLGGGFYLYPGARANVTASTVFSNAAGTAVKPQRRRHLQPGRRHAHQQHCRPATVRAAMAVASTSLATA
jgi:uncharacterized membrane protein